MAPPPDHPDALAELRIAHEHYRAALLPHPEEDASITYREYDEALNVALGALEAAVDAILKGISHESETET